MSWALCKPPRDRHTQDIQDAPLSRTQVVTNDSIEKAQQTATGELMTRRQLLPSAYSTQEFWFFNHSNREEHRTDSESPGWWSSGPGVPGSRIVTSSLLLEGLRVPESIHHSISPSMCAEHQPYTIIL